MKLGIVVVYMFGEDNAPLFDVHTMQIERCTTVPYTIYGSVNRLDPRLRQRVARNPRIRICEIPETTLRGMEEHSYYLGHLVEAAVADGATHVVTMHLDSFPVRAGWAEELAATLSDTCVFATCEGIQTACLFFERSFYLRYRPTFLLSESDRVDPRFASYLERHNPIVHSGIGYGFASYVNGLSWHYLPNTTRGDERVYGAVFDDIVFHLHGAVRLGVKGWSKIDDSYRSSFLRALRLLRSAGEALCPPTLRKSLRARFPTLTEHCWDRPWEYAAWRRMERIRRELLEDPDAYLRLLRGAGP